MSAVIPKFSYPVPANKNGRAFSTAEELLSVLGGESSGQYLVGSQGMWHGGIHITDATFPWCALSTDGAAERQYRNEPYKGEQFIRCMADGDIVAWRVCKDYASESIPWRNESLYFSTSLVLVKHYIQPGDTEVSGLTFYTLYMNLAPLVAYAQPGGERGRKTSGPQRYYTSTDDLQAGHAAGKLVKGTRVMLGDGGITRTSDRRQFSEVTLAEETTNAAGATLAAGTKIWTLSDGGNLTAEAVTPSPSWWTKCAPSYGTQPSGTVNCKTKNGWSYYLSSEDVLATKPEGTLTAGFPVSYEPDNAAQQVTRPDDKRTFSLVTLGRDVGKQKKGDRFWVVSDGDSLIPLTPSASAGRPLLGEVVIPPTPIAIKAGDSIGHMGFFQLPEENGKRSRYQVHIECLSMDSKLPEFLNNPGHVGEQAPAFLKYPEAAALFTKDAEGQMVDSKRKTLTQGITTRAKVPVIAQDGKPAYYQIIRENGWLAAVDVKQVAQYALGELGFVTLDKAPESFDLIDGIKHPDNVVKGILQQMYKAAQDETRISHALNKYNYKRLLELIDSNHDGHYSEIEYLQAVHNISYRDHLHRIIAKHGSEWYYGKGDPLWKTYLDTLTTDAPHWKAYTEAFVEKMTWMKRVPGMGPEPWHMHPVVFLGVLGFSAQLIDVDAFLNEYEKEHTSFAPGTAKLSHGGKSNLRKLLVYINIFYSQTSEYKPNLYRLAYMLATTRHETYHFTTGEYFSEKPEVGSVSYFNKYDPVLADTQARKKIAIANGNTNQGDGYKYRGRGCVHLTWKNNYQRAKDKYGVDFVNQEDLAGHFQYAIPIMIWGMEDGIFTGKKLSAYINNSGIDYENARKIINGSDQKSLIASYALKLQHILEKTSSVTKGFLL